LPDPNLDRFVPRRSTVFVAAALIVAEALLVGWYVWLSDATVYDATYLAYPFAWINVSVLAVWRTTPAPTTRRRRWIGAVAAVAYGLVLAVLGGLVARGYLLFGEQWTTSLRIAIEVPPGWGPALLYVGPYLRLSVIPFKLIGYLALSYLVYATVIDARGSAVSGVFGLFSCVSCSWPIVASLVTGITGAGTASFQAAFVSSYPLSTAIFVGTVALLYWRPFGR
jgi:hypothetical protein